jgi:hypothetical protein
MVRRRHSLLHVKGKLLIGFSTIVKKYSKIPDGCRIWHSRKPKGFRDVGNRQGIFENALQVRKPSRKPKMVSEVV